MENLDSLFENQNSGFDHSQPFDEEAWAARKQEQRAHLYETIDGMTDLTLSSAEALSKYLDMQSRLGRTSLSNTLLILAQRPDASYVMDFDDWHERGRSVKRNEKALLVLEANGEYERGDGTMGVRFDAKRVFDVSQTHGKPLRERTQVPIRSTLKALVKDSPFPVGLSDEVPQELGAQHSKEEKAVYVARNLDGETLFTVIARELAHVETMTGDYTVDEFISNSAAGILCRRYGVTPPVCDGIPESVSSMDRAEKKAVLGDIREAACEIMERVDRNLYAERQQQRDQPER